MNPPSLPRFKSLLLALLLFFVSGGGLLHAGHPELSALDDRRVAALISDSLPELEKIFSADLLYAHSNGKTDSRDSFLAALRDGSLKYHSLHYEAREFWTVSPDVVLMSGRARVEVGQIPAPLVLSFLAVWRLEKGSWRFLAWQSGRLPATP